MFEFFITLAREGLEAFLITSIVFTYLKKTGQNNLNKIVILAMIFSSIASLFLGLAVYQYGKLNYYVEIGLSLLSCLLVTKIAIKMFRLSYRKSQLDFDKLFESRKITSNIHLFVFLFLMLFREGIESVAILANTIINMESIFPFLSGGLGLLIAGLISILWNKLGEKINISLYFRIMNIFMGVFAINLWYSFIIEFIFT
jgi:FTR1 family protein